MSRGFRLLAGCLGLILLLLTGCRSSGPMQGPSPNASETPRLVDLTGGHRPLTPAVQGTPSPDDSLDHAIARAITYAHGITNVATLEALLHYAYRRFGVSEFAGARARYDSASRTAEDRVFRRVVDRKTVATPADLATLADTDPMVSRALYCDVIPLPDTYRTTLDVARSRRGYQLTHAMLALIMLDENGCTDVVTAGYRDSVMAEVAALATGSGPPTDLEIEAEAFLCLCGRQDLMEPSFIDRLVRAQRVDGGFAEYENSAVSSWHASGLALWVLLSARYPTAPRTGFIDSR